MTHRIFGRDAPDDHQLLPLLNLLATASRTDPRWGRYASINETLLDDGRTTQLREDQICIECAGRAVFSAADVMDLLQERFDEKICYSGPGGLEFYEKPLNESNIIPLARFSDNLIFRQLLNISFLAGLPEGRRARQNILGASAAPTDLTEATFNEGLRALEPDRDAVRHAARLFLHEMVDLPKRPYNPAWLTPWQSSPPELPDFEDELARIGKVPRTALYLELWYRPRDLEKVVSSVVVPSAMDLRDPAIWYPARLCTLLPARRENGFGVDLRAYDAGWEPRPELITGEFPALWLDAWDYSGRRYHWSDQTRGESTCGGPFIDAFLPARRARHERRIAHIYGPL